MNIIKCAEFGTATKHPKNSFYRNHTGSSWWLLMCFNTDFAYKKDGRMMEGKKYQCLIHPPHTPLVHGLADDENGFENDWIYFDGEGMESFIKELEIPLNESFNVENSNCLTKYINEISNEKKEHFFAEYNISGIIYNMLVNIARLRKMNDFNSCSFDSVKRVRKEMIDNFQQRHTIKSLADASGYSTSRFCELYKMFYDSSPIADLLKTRISMAKHYLLVTGLSVTEIAEICGFDNIHYFSSVFKKTVGCSPLQYRKNKNR